MTVDASTEPEVVEAAATTDAQEIDSDSEQPVMALPLLKIKRIFKMDPEYFGSSASAVYATGVATELFVQYLVENASMNAKVDKRKKIQYKDVSAAVAAQDSLFFLSDTVPKTQKVRDALKENRINVSEEDQATYKHLIAENDAPESEPAAPEEPRSPVSAQPALPSGQSTLPFLAVPNPTIKKAGLLALMSQDDGADQDDGMVVD